MRNLAVIAALIGMAAAPMAPAGAAETADTYAKGNIVGPSFARSTQCAAIYTVTAQLLGSADPGYQAAVNTGSGWFVWAGDIAEGRDAMAEMNSRKDEFTARTANMDNDGYNAELAKELQACLTVKTMFNGVEPFTSTFAAAGAPSGAPASAKPDVETAFFCIGNANIVSFLLGEEDPEYKLYEGRASGWSDYARSIYSGKEKDLVRQSKDVGGELGEKYDKLMKDDQAAGIDQIEADAIRCEGLQKAVPEFF